MNATDTQIHNLLRSTVHTPFQWGVHDCCTLANKAILIKTGVDVMGEYSGSYDTEYRSKRHLVKNHITVQAALDKHFSQVPYRQARLGDIVMINPRMLTVKVNGGVWCLTAKTVFVDKHPDVISTWRIE